MTVGQISKKYGININSIQTFVRREKEGKLKGHITLNPENGHRKYDATGVEIITNHFGITTEEQNETIERQKRMIEEKDAYIKKLEANYRLLELKLGNMKRELNQQI